MALLVWLPLNGSLKNNGIGNISVTNNGATVNTSGKIGSCYAFNGNDLYIGLAGSALFDCFKAGSNPFTLCMWIYHGDSRRAIIFGDYNTTGAINFNVELSTGHAVRFYWGGSPDYSPSGINVGASVWHHVAFTYDGSKLKSYLDGVLKATRDGALTAKSKTSGEFRLGRDSRTTDTALNGRLNDIRVYNNCLSEKEIKEISKGLVLHYHLNDWAPVGYHRLEYIESQGLILSLETNQAADICYEFTAWVSNNNSNYLFGSKQIGSMAYNGMYRATGIELNYLSQTLNSSINIPAMITLYLSISNTTITNVLNGVTTTHTIGNLNSGDTGNICFFGIPNSSPRYYGNKVRLYWLKIKNSSGIVRNLIPVKRLSDNKTGMYDLKNNVFLCTNINTSVTSNFIAGPTVGLPSNTIYDCSGYLNNGTLVGTANVNIPSPRYTSSINLVNTSSMINCGRGAMVTDSLTVNFWCYAISGDRPASCTEGGGWNFEPSNSNILFAVYLAGVGYCSTGASAISMSSLNNAWHMYTGVYDRLNSKSRLYIDGELAKENSFSGTGLLGYNSSNVIWIGGEATSSNTTGSAGTAGYFSDFRIYSTALSSADIKELYEKSMIIDSHGYASARKLTS